MQKELNLNVDLWKETKATLKNIKERKTVKNNPFLVGAKKERKKQKGKAFILSFITLRFIRKQ